MPEFEMIYGTAWKKDRTAALVTDAYNAGFRAFDTACQPRHYNEPLVGEALAGLTAKGVARESYHLQTKFTPVSGQDPNQIPYDATAPLAEQVKQSCAVSLKNLHTGYLDALVLHSPLSTPNQLMDVWQAMEACHESGGARALGISNCYDLDLLQYLWRRARIKPRIVQNRFYERTGFDLSVRRWCRANDIQYQSFWTLTANPQLLESNAVVRLVWRLKKTPAQILFRYLQQRQVTPLTGTTDPEHMREDLAASQFTLGDADLEAIDALIGGA